MTKILNGPLTSQILLQLYYFCCSLYLPSATFSFFARDSNNPLKGSCLFQGGPLFEGGCLSNFFTFGVSAYSRVGAYSRGRMLDIPVSRVGAYSRVALIRSITVYCYHIDIYLCLFAFKSLRRTTLRFKVLHFLLKSLRNGGIGGGAKLIYSYEA